MAAIADRVAVMYAGRIVEMGSTLQVFDNPSHPYTRALLRCLPDVELKREQLVEIGGQPPDLARLLPAGCPFAPRCPERQSICDEAFPPTVDVAGGHVAQLLGRCPRRGLEPDVKLEAIGLKKYFPVTSGFSVSGTRGWIKAVDGVSVEVAEGETLGIVGESGSGKTTLAKLFLLLERPTAGALLFDGKEIAAFARGDLARYRRSVQAVFQDPYSSLNPRMRVETHRRRAAPARRAA